MLPSCIQREPESAVVNPFTGSKSEGRYPVLQALRYMHEPVLIFGCLAGVDRKKSAESVGAGGHRGYNEMKLNPWSDESVMEGNLLFPKGNLLPQSSSKNHYCPRYEEMWEKPGNRLSITSMC
ncbi:MAG: hypothetical protein AMK69_19755 [Nitrospira bacterium SG8_3]|nr:MAG: hypothetical protein AMK69_19755 [Nitrospira bacterium SG8_3]